MDPRKFDKEILDKLPLDLQKEIAHGNVIAVPLAKPAMSSTFFTVALAILFAGTVTPLCIPANAFIIMGLGIAAMGWLLMYAVTDRLSCIWQNKYHLVSGLNEGMFKLVEKTLDKQEDTDGTKSDSDCLNERSTGSDEVQGDGK